MGRVWEKSEVSKQRFGESVQEVRVMMGHETRLSSHGFGAGSEDHDTGVLSQEGGQSAELSHWGSWCEMVD